MASGRTDQPTIGPCFIPQLGAIFRDDFGYNAYLANTSKSYLPTKEEVAETTCRVRSWISTSEPSSLPQYLDDELGEYFDAHQPPDADSSSRPSDGHSIAQQKWTTPSIGHMVAMAGTKFQIQRNR